MCAEEEGIGTPEEAGLGNMGAPQSDDLPDPPVDYKVRAEEMLAEAYDVVKDRHTGIPQKDIARIASEAGIGYALLANGLDAEVFYALFHGPDDQATMNTWSSEV
jgi:hypothetical protein